MLRYSLISNLTGSLRRWENRACQKWDFAKKKKKWDLAKDFNKEISYIIELFDE